MNSFGGFAAVPGPLIEEFGNVEINDPQTSDILTFDAESNLWKNKPIGKSTVVTYIGMTVQQRNHGLAIMDQVYKNREGNWVLAKGDSITTLRQASVYGVVDENNFTLVFTGLIQIPSHGFNIGSIYYLSSTVAGAVTSTPSDGGIYYNQPIFVVLDSNTLKIYEQLNTTLASSTVPVRPQNSDTYIPKPADLKTNTVEFACAKDPVSGTSVDVVHFNSADTPTRGGQNLLVLGKSSLDARLFKGGFGGGDYSQYRNFILTDESASRVELRGPLKFTDPPGGKALRLGWTEGMPTDGEPYVSAGKDQSLIKMAHFAGIACQDPSHRFYTQNTSGCTESVRLGSTNHYKLSGGVWGTLSDERSKQDIRKVRHCLEKVKALEPVYFEYKPEFGTPGCRTGFVAQDVEKILAGHVREIESLNGIQGPFKTMSPDFLPYVVGALQSLSTIAEQQRGFIQNQTRDIECAKNDYNEALARLQYLENVL